MIFLCQIFGITFGFHSVLSPLLGLVFLVLSFVTLFSAWAGKKTGSSSWRILKVIGIAFLVLAVTEIILFIAVKNGWDPPNCLV